MSLSTPPATSYDFNTLLPCFKESLVGLGLPSALQVNVKEEPLLTSVPAVE